MRRWTNVPRKLKNSGFSFSIWGTAGNFAGLFYFPIFWISYQLPRLGQAW
jgi:hypothetical protein